MKVKLFYADFKAEMEQKINEWLSNVVDIKGIGIKYVTQSQNVNGIVITIWYDECR